MKNDLSLIVVFSSVVFDRCEADVQSESDEKDFESSMRSEHDYSGVVHAKIYRIIEETDREDKQALSDYDNINHVQRSAETKTKSNEDIVSLNLVMTSPSSSERNEHDSMTFTGESVDQQDANKQDNDHYHHLEQRTEEENQLIMINPTSDCRDEDQDGFFSDQSHYSDDIRYVNENSHKSIEIGFIFTLKVSSTVNFLSIFRS